MIFSKRNNSDFLSKGFIDLHGLHVSEAITCVKEIIDLKIKKENAERKVVEYHFFENMREKIIIPNNLTFITGSGHHTQSSGHEKSRLLPAIENLLIHVYNLKPLFLKDSNNFIGGLRITL